MNINKYTPILLAAFLVANACTSKIKESNPSTTKEVVSTKIKNLTGKRFVRDRNLDEKVNENPELSIRVVSILKLKVKPPILLPVVIWELVEPIKLLEIKLF